MPRVSMKPEDMMGDFFKEGNVEITSCKCVVFQYPPNKETGEQGEPFTAVQFGFKQLREDFSVDDDAEGQEIQIKVGTLDKIRPGSLDNPDDLEAEPEDLGSDVGTEGNSIYGDEGAKLGFGWPPFIKSLRDCNFRPNVIDRIYMPDYIGMKAHLKKGETGRTYQNKQGKTVSDLQWMVTKIHTFPYDKAATKAAGKAAVKAAGNKAAGKSKAEESPAASESGSPLDLAINMLSNPSDRFKKVVKGDTEIKIAVFRQQMNLELVSQKVDTAERAPFTAWLKKDESIQELGDNIGFAVDIENGTVTFPAWE